MHMTDADDKLTEPSDDRAEGDPVNAQFWKAKSAEDKHII
ncbi:hypothetical protein SDC9_203858 [bioreactor metagenome]|uniref:Uncharacterized protein n=1 Tax=bioreactor metagenome TaxID=1076179 RepID=A0A645IZ87_9ZZZZ